MPAITSPMKKNEDVNIVTLLSVVLVDLMWVNTSILSA